MSGFGTSGFGTTSYGSVDTTPPYVTGAISLSGTEIELFFSEEMDTNDPSLVDPATYDLTVLVGVSAAITAVVVNQVIDQTSVIITHTGTTLGGVCKIRVVGEPSDIAGNVVVNVVDVPEPDPFNALGQSNEAILFTLGDEPSLTVGVPTGNGLLLEFSEDLLESADEPVGSTGVGDTTSYGFVNTIGYPIEIAVNGVIHPYEGDSSRVLLHVQGMTSIEYEGTVSPATAIAYTPTALPSDSPDFIGTETGTGSSEVSSDTLLMSKPAGVSYGWSFEDLSGRVIEECTFRVDFEFDASGTAFNPALGTLEEPSVGTLVFEDGVRSVGVTLKQGSDGSDTLLLESGAYSTEVSADWSSDATTLSIIRNRKAGIYTFLINGYPVMSEYTATLDGAPGFLPSPGVAWFLSEGVFSVEGFQVRNLKVTATNTVYTAKYNFLHNVTASFMGSAASTRSSFLTQKGPLTKGWGDATPATKQDVQVYINGTEVEVESVNPYYGEVTTAIPIPLLPPGTVTITTDYKWFPSPIMEHAKLNTPGLLLNQWVHATGHHYPPHHGYATTKMGLYPAGRFPFSSVLGPVGRRQPLQIGYRYLGFEKAYSALLNSPTTLLLNQFPNRAAVPGFTVYPQGVTGAYEGTTKPTEDPLPWGLVGTDAGGVNVGEGTYTVVDNQSGVYDPDAPSVVLYHRGLDLSFPASWYVVGRFEGVTSVPDGVFTGVGFGIHDNNRLYLVGALVINGVEHVGLLANARRPHEAGAWHLGLCSEVEAIASNVLSIATASTPNTLASGDRLQVLGGSQAGVYTVGAFARQSDGTTIISLTSNLPEPVDTYGNKFLTAVFETRWSGEVSTYRLEVKSASGDVSLQKSGGSTATLLTLTGSLSMLPEPAETSLLLPITEDGGQVFWGSLSYEATNETVWSFARYGVVPDEKSIRGYQKVVRATMERLPEDETDEWSLTKAFGTASVDATGSRVLIKSDCGSADYRYSYGYARIENFLAPQVWLEVNATFRVETGNMGAGDALISIKDTRREIRVANLLYVEDPTADEYRRLIRLPSMSMSGLLLPTEQGWLQNRIFDLSCRPKNDVLLMQQSGGTIGGYFGQFDASDLGTLDTGGRIIEARFAIKSSTPSADKTTGIYFQGSVGVGGTYRTVGMEVLEDGVRLVTVGRAKVQDYTFDWTDGGEHTYRILADEAAGTVTLVIDDEEQVPTTAIAAYSGAFNNSSVTFGIWNTDESGSVDLGRVNKVEWAAVSVVAYPPVSAFRTLGIYRGGDDQHIDSWEIPRTDSSPARNSEQVGPVIENMDWRFDVEVKLVVDPGWGVTLFRPDMPTPPYYVAEDSSVPGTGHSSMLVEPSAGWINLEMGQIPLVPSMFSMISFGALDSRAVTQQRWSNFRYRVFKHLLEDRTAPHHMLLNQFNVVHSGERSKDRVPEVVEIQTVNSTTVSLKPTHYYADYIYKVVDGSTIFTPDEFSFDPSSQVITLLEDSEGNAREFSADQVIVRVVFKHSSRVTTTYLEAQPLSGSVHILNEDTPPIAKSQVGVATRSVNADRVVIWTDNPDHLYEELTFLEIDNGGVEGVLSAICEGTLAERSGWEEGVGDEILDSSGTGTGTYVGAPYGSFIIGLSGADYEEMVDFTGVDDINPTTNTGSVTGLGSATIEIDNEGVVTTYQVESLP